MFSFEKEIDKYGHHIKYRIIESNKSTKCWCGNDINPGEYLGIDCNNGSSFCLTCDEKHLNVTSLSRLEENWNLVLTEGVKAWKRYQRLKELN